jgi:ribokinase
VDSRVCVLGSINMDVVVRVARFPARGETVPGLSCDLSPGGKGANQAIAAANMGVPVDLIGALGTDEFGRLLGAYLAESGVNVDSVARVSGPSGTAVVMVDAGGQNQIIVTPGANELIPHEAVESYFRHRGVPVRHVVAQFEVPLGLIEYAFGKAKELGATTVLNPAPAGPLPHALIGVTDVIVLNEVELPQAAGLVGTVASPDDAAAAAARWSGLIGGKTVVVTLGGQGIVAVDGGRVIRQPAPAVDRVVDTTGAGDCFCGALVAFLHKGYPLEESLRFAQRAAAQSVQRPGASPSFPKLPDLGSSPAVVLTTPAR